MNNTATDITRGTPHFFADLKLPDTAERQTTTCPTVAVSELL